MQLSLEELPCQNLLLPSLALWRQIAARDAQDGIAVVGRATHAVAIATEVDLLLRHLGVLEYQLPRPLNRRFLVPTHPHPLMTMMFSGF